jgi:hypothetical protein
MGMPECPRCQAPYETGARFCQQCGAALIEPEPAKTPAPEPEPTPAAVTPGVAGPPSRRPPAWLLALAGAGLIAIILAVFFFTQTGAPPPEPAAPVPEGSLQDQLANLMGTLRQAQINKDVSRFMSCYAATFPDREQKRQEALKAWTKFDFTAMFFYLEEVNAAGPETARAKVTWDIQVQDKSTQEFLTSAQTFQVEFVKEQGEWRIRSLQEITTP